jgi:hypothetical protein
MRAKHTQRTLGRIAAAAIVALAAGRAGASGDAAGVLARPALTDAQLDRQRGGLDLGGGVSLYFGIQNLVFTNGELIARTTFTLDPTALDHLRGLVQVVRDGAVAPETLAATDLAVANVIQNSLDSQLIQSLSVLDVSVEGLDALRGLQMNELFGRQMIDLP